MALTKAELEELISKLSEIPPPSDEERIISKNEVIAGLRPVIRKLKAKGYTPPQIHEILSSSGVKISRYQVELSVKKKRQTSSRKRTVEKPTNQISNETNANTKIHQDEGNKAASKKERSGALLDKSKGDYFNKPSESVRGSAHFTPDPDVEKL